MSTHGIIAFGKHEGSSTKWEGRYHHSDSYPTSLGKYLFDSFQGFFQRDFATMKRYLLEEHPAGYSYIVGADLSLPCGYTNDHEARWEKDAEGRVDFSKPIPYGPVCYCHGDRAEESYLVTDETTPDTWAYVISDYRYSVFMTVLREVFDAEDTCSWEEVARIDLAEAEPNWEEIECGKNFERCSHVAEKHFPELKGTSMARLGVDTFLGRTPLDSHDVMAYQIGERRFSAGGGGSRGNDGRGAEVWIAMGVKPEDDWYTIRNLVGKYKNFSTYYGSGGHHYGGENKFDMIVGKYDKKTRKRVPYSGVTYIYPPTVNEPIRLLAELRKKFVTSEGQSSEELALRSGLAAALVTGRHFRDEERITA